MINVSRVTNKIKIYITLNIRLNLHFDIGLWINTAYNIEPNRPGNSNPKNHIYHIIIQLNSLMLNGRRNFLLIS